MEFVYKGVVYSEKNGHLVVEGLDDVNKTGMLYIPASIQEKCVTEIADSAFEGALISKVYLPYSINIIGERAFGYCENLQGVEANITVKVPAVSSCLQISENAFSACKNLRHLKTNQSLILKNYAFAQCTNLERIDRLLSVAEKSFLGCAKLKSIFLQNNCDLSDFSAQYSNVEKCDFYGDATISAKFIDSLLESGCNIECFSTSNLCDLLYMGVNITIEDLPF